jgi:hypothetical protein
VGGGGVEPREITWIIEIDDLTDVGGSLWEGNPHPPLFLAGGVSTPLAAG